MCLTKDQINSYSKDGFIFVKELFSIEEINNMSIWIDNLASKEPIIGREIHYYEDDLLMKNNKILNRIEKFCDYNKDAHNVAYSKKIMGILGQLFGEPPILFKDKINFKNPGGSGFKAHQDIQSGWLEYATTFISVLITIDDSTEENGCLEIASGHNKRGWIGRMWHPLEGNELKGLDFEIYEASPGDVIFFDCFTPHLSGDNLSKNRRRNIYFTYNKLSEGNKLTEYYNDKDESYLSYKESNPNYNESNPNMRYIFSHKGKV